MVRWTLRYMLVRELGIDIGTSNIRIFIPKQGIVLEEPSIIATDATTGRVIGIGASAEEMIDRAPEEIIVHRPLIAGNINDQQAARHLLEWCLKKVLGRLNIFRPDIVVSIPTEANSMEQRVMIETCKQIPVREVFPEREGILSGLGTGIHAGELKGRMVADIGAGKTDVAVISLGGMLSHGSVPVGGRALDEGIAQYIQEKYKIHIGRHTAEKLKNTIGAASIMSNTKTARVRGKDATTGFPKIVQVNTTDIAEGMRQGLMAITEVIGQVFSTTPPELTSDIIDHGIVLTGGVAQIPQIDRFIATHLQTPVRIAEDPSRSVVRGIGKLLQTGGIPVYRQSLLAQ